jgi:hypothetical protein
MAIKGKGERERNNRPLWHILSLEQRALLGGRPLGAAATANQRVRRVVARSVRQLTLPLPQSPNDGREVLRYALVECIEVKRRCRVVCISQCANPQWYCAFPYELRSVGQRYRVDLIAMPRRYYRASGFIEAIDSDQERS